ncbi:hypothetical protein BUE80_DR000985 [Diplocarpon rosae]|nr:hypothetical protein BUE80_DR000985 [Diplocarpon rosae]
MDMDPDMKTVNNPSRPPATQPQSPRTSETQSAKQEPHIEIGRERGAMDTPQGIPTLESSAGAQRQNSGGDPVLDDDGGLRFVDSMPIADDDGSLTTL